MKLDHIDVMSSIRKLGSENVSARSLCNDLVETYHNKEWCQVAIQRSITRGDLLINHNWTLSEKKNLT